MRWLCAIAMIMAAGGLVANLVQRDWVDACWPVVAALWAWCTWIWFSRVARLERILDQHGIYDQ